MYDKGPVPGRNEPCWCGSGKKYKKCHANEDEKLQELYNDGHEVLVRSLLKTPKDIDGIKYSAEVNIGVLDYVGERIGPGVSTAQIDKWVYDFTVAHDAIPAPLNYEGFPKSVCTSINDVVCHGIPSEEEVLKDGDIVNVDCSTIRNGYFSDSSRMFMIGDVSPERRKLVDVTKESIQRGLAAVKPWGYLGDMAHAVQSYVEENGFSVVREFGGHGIGKEFHEDPFVGFVGEPGEGVVLAPGMCFTIEPMVNAGGYEIDMSDPNGWTVRTKDGSDSAQWEVQLVVTDTGYELLSW
ncbi:methionyl aminopeptidase [uncultured Parolsenella sp.]|uniref:methionyl aminopeptidase n=1 Tax=uncultured Parolsenella sp. TaxID=2083008 RepID=UPI0027D97D12|nr:methionyl aminopeptidase [uncultured Parolsenella sp.]